MSDRLVCWLRQVHAWFITTWRVLVYSRWNAGQILHDPPDVVTIVNVVFWRGGKGDDWESLLVPPTLEGRVSSP